MNFGVITLNQSIKTMQNYVIWILAKFNEFANAFGLLDKIRDGKISLTDARNDQAEFKSNVSEIKKGDKKHRSKEQKIHCIILKCFTKQGTVLLNFLIIILQSYPKQTLKQLNITS